MKNYTKFVCMFVIFALLLGCFGNLAAQNTSTTGYDDDDADVYTVMPGDSAWRIAGNLWENPTLWQKVVEKNPFLKQKGRITVNPANGWTYVMMRPGEQLFGLQELGITAPTPTPISELGIKTPDPVVIREVPQWTWWILGIALGFLVLCWLLYRMLTRDPVNSRPAMVPGGVTNETVTPALQQVAARAAGHSGGVSTSPRIYQQFVVVRQTAGRIWGNMTVRYADGRSIPRRLNGERAYEAEVRFPDGRTETLYMLQGCGNDLRYGGISRYLPGSEFRFEADPAPTAPTQPAMQPAAQTTPEPAAQTAPAPEPIQTQSDHEDLLKISFRPEEGGKDSLVQAEGVDVERFTFEKNGSSITFRFREAKK